ncbi:MAG: hypothetical protein HY909_02365 [Deltaproteobacteria bacterium]|nr:hypothetical protein [Deltaproteobacteria bacterium]
MKRHTTTMFAALAAAVALGPASALAGSLELRDEAGLFDEAAVQALRAEASRQPFDVRVWTTARYADRWALDRATAAMVVAPDVLAVTLDPAHRRTSVHVGTGLRIPTTRYRALGDAGDVSFRAGRWGDGVVAITRTAGQWAQAGGPAGRASEGPGFPWGLVLVGAGLVAVIAVTTRMIRRRQQEPTAYRGDAYRTPYVPQEPYGPNAGPGYYPPGYAPPSGGGVGSHIAAAGLGGLAGYALGSALSDRHEGASHDGGHAPGNTSGDTGYDAGGSTSGWDDGGGGGDFGGGDAGGGDFGGGGDW